eukprot:symbB.v1.2.026557.t1/scaffold2664.1/size73528/7
MWSSNMRSQDWRVEVGAQPAYCRRYCCDVQRVGECGNSWKASPRLIQTVQLTVLCHLAGSRAKFFKHRSLRGHFECIFEVGNSIACDLRQAHVGDSFEAALHVQSQGGSGLGFAAGFAAGAAAASATSGDSQGGGASSFSSWLLLLAQSLFDVSTDDVVRRLKLLVPKQGDRSAAEELRTRPDFYGPFWVATTAVLFLAATGNFARLIESPHPSHFKADYSLVPLAATLVYGGLIAVPLLARLSVFFTDEEVSSIDFKHIVCVYGYALAPAIPVSILCIIPVGFLRWLFVLAGMALSLYFLKGNLLEDISVKVRWLQLTLIAAPVILQVLVLFVYRVRFFAGDRE